MFARDRPWFEVPPRVHLMATGDWSTMVTAAGSGYGHWRGLAITRWQPDAVCDVDGCFVLLRDTATGHHWSTTWQPVSPTASAPQHCEVTFDEGCTRFERREGTIFSVLEVAPLASGSGEVRRIELVNEGEAVRCVDVVSYLPLVLGLAAADAAHPAYSKMFVQTARIESERFGELLLAWRRKGSPDDPDVVAAHGCCSEGEGVQNAGFETDRMQFIGRGRSLHDALALSTGAPAPGRVGSVLDPVFSLRRRVTLAPGARVCLAFWTVAAPNRESVLDCAAGCWKQGVFRQALADGSATARARRLKLHLSESDVEVFQRLGAGLLYGERGLRASSDQLARASGGPPVLWSLAISGDRPIALARIDQAEQSALVEQLLAAQRWWDEMGIGVDVVVVWDGHADGSLGKRLDQAKENRSELPLGGAFHVVSNQDLTDAQRDGLAAAARLVFDGEHGGLADQLRRVRESASPHPWPDRVLRSDRMSVAEREPVAENPAQDAREFFNGQGGFADDGREYVIDLAPGQRTPMPWVNVVANAGFGFTVSAEGGGYAWSINSQKNALTRWTNDAVRDDPGDVLYVRDADSGAFWSATPAPARAPTACEVRHGRGYTRFRQQLAGVASDLVQFVPMHDPVKVSVLRLKNLTDRARQLDVTAYVQWTLGANGEDTAAHVVTARDDVCGALVARNDWRADYVGRIAFADLGGQVGEWTCDRGEFLGAQGHLSAPAALRQGVPLSGACGAGLEPCAALRATVRLQAGEEREVVFLLGEAADMHSARALVMRYRQAKPEAILDEVRRHWQDIGDAVQVTTPDRRLDLLVNGWLPYQIISCRLHARTAFYQASGAWGFRDQLQDVAALVLSAPHLVREHLLRAAGRQFVEGDVQHWWLPPSGAGVRTRIADDRLWLPYVTAHYVRTTGDGGVLDESVAFLEGQPLPDDRIDDFATPKASSESGTLFEHGARAIEASLKTGAHGVPLFGTGDWNDGMNRVGRHGRGESVWMGWFLIAVIRAFAPIARARGAADRAATWDKHADALAGALQRHAWDGQWWLRGWYDDGTPLGSHASAECRIDGIAQSWAVMSQAADQARARQGMEAVDRMLVRRDARLVALLTPPFDRAEQDPGYIKGYPPGLRENGGQYTHGSVWAAIAFAMLGDGDRAHELFSLLEPISHAQTPEDVDRWKVEPYVACADVYTAPGHLGRGGWTWYTGTAGWLYRAATEWLLGIRVQDQTLRLDPCIPRAWPGFSVRLRWRSSSYQIEVENPTHVCHGLTQCQVDGRPQDPSVPIALQGDGAVHRVRVTLG